MICSKNLGKIFVVLLLFSASQCLAPSTCAAEKVYQVTETELQEWQAELNLQKKLISELRETDKQQRLQLVELRKQLEISKKALADQKQQLSSSTQALTDANNSLIAYAAEEKAKQNRLIWQRNVAWGAAAVLAIALIRR